MMKRMSALLLAGALATGLTTAHAQNDSGAKQDMKNAGTDTKDAAKNAGNGVKQGTKKGYHKTKKATKKAAKKVSGDDDSSTTTTH